MELLAGGAVNLGFGISAARAAASCSRRACTASVTWVIEQGAVGGVPLPGFAFGCAANADAIMPSPLPVHLLPGRRLRRSLLSFMEVDADGNVNVSRLAAKPHVTAGCGGFVDITAHARKLVFSRLLHRRRLEARRRRRAAVDPARRQGHEVRAGGRARHLQRAARRATGPGRHLRHRALRACGCMPDGLTVTEIAPGIDLAARRAGAGGDPAQVAAGPAPMDARLFTDAPMGLALPRAAVASRRRARKGTRLSVADRAGDIVVDGAVPSRSSRSRGPPSSTR